MAVEIGEDLKIKKAFQLLNFIILFLDLKEKHLWN